MSKKVGLIGLGKQAINEHIPCLTNSESVRLEAICDINEEKLHLYQNKLNVRGYKDYQDLISNEALDFIIIAVPHFLHPEIIKIAAQNRVHIIKEKPFARNLEEGSIIKNICASHRINLMTLVNHRFTPSFEQANTFFDQVGDLFFVEAKHTLSVAKLNVDWRRDLEQSGGGCILDMGYHLIDLIIWYFGLPDYILSHFSNSARPNENYNTEDTAIIMFRYKKGLYGSIILSRCYPPKSQYMKIVGCQGTLDISKDRILRIENSGRIVETSFATSHTQTPMQKQIEIFCNVLEEKSINPSTPDYNLQHLAFVEACYKSKIARKYINPQILLRQYL